MKWYHYLICFSLIIAGIFSSIELFQLFDLKSADYGTVLTIETKNNYSQISRFDVSSSVFESTDNTTYTIYENYAPETFNGTNKDYVILLNGNMSNDVVVSAGKISGDVDLDFYDTDGSVITTAKINVLVEYLSSGVKLSITTTNTNNSISYLSTYMQLNGFVVSVVERGAV